jgi:hypothetical protein
MGEVIELARVHKPAGTKTCPRCGAALFEDMPTCYNCMLSMEEVDTFFPLLEQDSLATTGDAPLLDAPREDGLSAFEQAEYEKYLELHEGAKGPQGASRGTALEWVPEEAPLTLGPPTPAHLVPYEQPPRVPQELVNYLVGDLDDVPLEEASTLEASIDKPLEPALAASLGATARFGSPYGEPSCEASPEKVSTSRPFALVSAGGAPCEELDEERMRLRQDLLDTTGCLALPQHLRSSWALVVETGCVRMVHVVPPEGLRIGRAPQNDIVLADPAVSRAHVELTPAQTGVMVQNCGAKNPALLQGEPVRTHALMKPGQRLAIGAATTFFLTELDRL